MTLTSACTVVVVVVVLLAISCTDSKEVTPPESRDSYLDAYVDSQGSVPTEKDSPPTGVVEAASGPDLPESYNTLDGPSSYHANNHQYPPSSGYSTMSYSGPSYQAPVPPPHSSYSVPHHPALPLEHGVPSHSYENPSSYSHPPSAYSHPPPAYSQHAPSYYSHPSPTYSTPSPAYGGPAYYGTPSPQYGPPAHAYGPPAPTYGTTTKSPHPMTAYGPPDRGMGGIPFHTILQILLKVLIFKAIVKFIAIICVLLFLPKFDLGHGPKEDDSMRRYSNEHAASDQLDSLTKLVTAGIGRDFKQDQCEGDSFCRLAQISKRVDSQYTLMRLMTIFMSEYFDDYQRPDISPAVPSIF